MELQKKRKGAKKVFKEIGAKYFSNLAKDMNS
jgi:hypothetical protein